MTSYERFKRMYEHREADRIPVIDIPWRTTIERWHKEGMPEGISYVDFFGLDKVASIGVDNSPRYDVEVLEETEEYIITTTPWGATLKEWKHADSTPEFLDFKIKDMERWLEAKEL
jgi:uroporphyrinogen decarboxylase